MTLFEAFDFLGTAAFAISGALAAINKRLDVFGILIIAFVTSVGGGTLRDMLIGTYHFLDMVPNGRDEANLSYSMEWIRHHDRYDEKDDPGFG